MEQPPQTDKPASGYTIKDWDSLQHYKDRNPPWIKLHYELLTKDYWVMLDDASKLLAVASMMLASRNNGIVPNNPEYIRRVAHFEKLPKLAPLVDAGFLIPIGDTQPPHTDGKRQRQRQRQRQSASELLAHASTFDLTTKTLQSLAEWIKHREQIKKPLTELALEKLAQKLKKLGDDRACDAVNRSIENGWAGVFEDKNANVGQKTRTKFVIVNENGVSVRKEVQY